MLRRIILSFAPYGVLAGTVVLSRELCEWLYMTNRIGDFCVGYLGTVGLLPAIVGHVVMQLQCRKAFAVSHDDGRLNFIGAHGSVVPFTHYLRGDFNCAVTVTRVVHVWWLAKGLSLALVLVGIYFSSVLLFCGFDISATMLWQYSYTVAILLGTTIMGSFTGTTRWLLAPAVEVKQHNMATDLTTQEE